uniref:Glycosyltransferase RgtA/B/C/D-like domain-containing protein n=1 Tax=Ignisphaera aggregans TaxID=334771 RepID=A0A7J2U1N3_9CREN
MRISAQHLIGRMTLFARGFARGGATYVVVGVLLGLSMLLLAVYSINVFVGYAYVTIGRVSFWIEKPLEAVARSLAIASLVLALISLILLTFTLGFRPLLSISYAALVLLSFFLSPPLVLIPLAILLIVSLSAMRGCSSCLNGFVMGLIYSIAGVEIVVLLYNVALLAGFRLPWLSSIVSFELCSWALLWPLAIAILLLSSAILLLRFGLGIGGGDVARGSSAGGTIFAVASVMLATIMGLVGYMPTVNSYGAPLNVDWAFYYDALQRMLASSNPFAEAFRAWPVYGDRPLYMILLYIVSKTLSIDPKTLCLYHNIFLFQLYALSTYFMTRKLLGEYIARYAALIAVATPNIASFVYGGFQADLFTLSLMQFAIGLAYTPSLRSLVAVSMLSLVALLTHVYTWVHFAALFIVNAVAMLVLSLYRRDFDRRSVIMMLSMVLLVVVGVVSDAGVSFFLGKLRLISIEYFWNQVVSGLKSLKQLNFHRLWSDMEFYMNIYTGGSLNNPLYWLLFAISTLLTPINTGIISYTYASTAIAVAMFAINPLYAYRMLINTPTAPIVAAGMSRLGKWERALIIVSLYSVALTKTLSFIPGLKLP